MEILLKYHFRAKLNTRLPRYSEPVCVSQNHRTVWAGKDLWWSASLSDLPVTISPTLTQHFSISQSLPGTFINCKAFPPFWNSKPRCKKPNGTSEFTKGWLQWNTDPYHSKLAHKINIRSSWSLSSLSHNVWKEIYWHLQKRFSRFLSRYTTTLKL